MKAALIFGFLTLFSVSLADSPAQEFRGQFLGIDIDAQRLGIVLDVSESMEKFLPAISSELKKKTPRSPMIRVDGCRLEKPEPRAKAASGIAPDPITAFATLSEAADVDGILWICDLADPPNRAGIEFLDEWLEESRVRIYLLSFGGEPTRSVRSTIIENEGIWKTALSVPLR